MEKRIKKMPYNGFGFQLTLTNVPVKNIRGNLEPVVNYKDLGREVILVLVLKKNPLTGHQLKFMRGYFEMTLREFASVFGLSHQAVMKWEERGDKFAHISPATEKMVRLDALFRLGVKPQILYKAFSELKDLASDLQSSQSIKEQPLNIAM